MGDQLTVFDLLVSARAQPAALALTERAAGPRTAVLLQLLKVPALVDVAGLFRWATEGDIALLDADHGLLVINPHPRRDCHAPPRPPPPRWAKGPRGRRAESKESIRSMTSC